MSKQILDADTLSRNIGLPIPSDSSAPAKTHLPFLSHRKQGISIISNSGLGLVIPWLFVYSVEY